MDLKEAKQYLNNKGYYLVEASRLSREAKIDFAKKINEYIKKNGDKIDQKSYEDLKEFQPDEILNWIGTKHGEGVLPREDRWNVGSVCRFWHNYDRKIQYKIAHEKENDKRYEYYKEQAKLWPEFKKKFVEPMIALGGELKKIVYHDDYYGFDEFVKERPETAKLGKIPFKISFRFDNGIDVFYFEDTDIDLETVTHGNYDTLIRLGRFSDGKAKYCKAIQEYQRENRNTWTIPMDMFMGAIKEFVNAKDYLTDEEIEEIKRNRAEADAWAKGVTEFYATSRYHGD